MFARNALLLRAVAAMGTALAALAIPCPASAQALAAKPADPDAKAAAVEARMTDAERLQLLNGLFPTLPPSPPDLIPAAGHVPGVPRLGVPDLNETDASLGVSNLGEIRNGDVATALPAGLALAASFDPELAYRTGAMIGSEARAKGFNVILAGGMNLTRNWYDGRNFEYLGEDPLLSGTMAGASVRGIQSRGVISTVKHFSLDSQESQSSLANVRISEAGHRESDLLAFEIAIEKGQPGAVMCAYNLVNDQYACANDHLLNGVLKHDWGYRGWVMSDWGAVHSIDSFNAGLDQESGWQLDTTHWFDAPLKAEIAAGRVTKTRVSDAVRRILRSIYAVGADLPRGNGTTDYNAHAAIARQEAAEGIVLLKNDGILPLAKTATSILVVGGYANAGVMSGWGSSQVRPVGGFAAQIPAGGNFDDWLLGSTQNLVPSSPLKALREALPQAKIGFESGYYPATAVARAAHSDIVVVFATRWQTEGMDASDLDLPQGQNALIAAIAKANPNVVVVLETGNPVQMPWLSSVKAVLEAWYPGQKGGEAIADVLTGAVNPSGRLPMTFPAEASQAPRSSVPGLGLPGDGPLPIDDFEGADVGYRWFAAKGITPAFAFGYGLSYTSFAHSAPAITGGRPITARLTVRNTGDRDGADVVQLYLVDAAGKPARRLAAFQRVELKAGQSREITLAVDSRLIASWESTRWHVRGGRYRFAIGTSAESLGKPVGLMLPDRYLAP